MNSRSSSGNVVERHRRTFDHPWRVAVVSLFSKENLGVRAVFSFLKACGYDVDLVFLKDHATNRYDMPTNKERRLLISLLKEREVKAVAFRVLSPYTTLAGELTSQIHEELGIPVIWGGVAATLTPETCIELGADYAVCGEGEETMAELATALADGGDPTTVRNVWRKGPAGPVGNTLRPLIKDLDGLPFTDLDDDSKYYIDFGRVRSGDPWRKGARYELITSRGCPFNCAFCSNSQFHELYRGLGAKVRTRGVQHVIREIEHARERMPGMRFVFFTDEVFGLDLEWLREFRDAYRKRVNLPFGCCLDPRVTTDERLDLLADAGLVLTEIGIQSGSERLRKELFNRPVGNDKILADARRIRKHRVSVRYDIISDNPFETADDKRATFDLLLRLPHPFILNLFSLNYFPKTALTERALTEGIITENEVAGNSTKCLEQFLLSFDYPRPKEDQFWSALYSLSSKWFVPRPLLRRAAQNGWFVRHPAPLVAFAKASSTARLLANGVQMLIQGRINWRQIRRFSRSLGRVTR